jgi:glutathione synthase/RimK-type ligase-like ATP-grasp enzyme
MRIALASCSKLPAWEVDDRPLEAALRARGVDLRVVPWDADVDWSGFDAVLLRTTWDYQDRAADFLAWLDRVGPQTTLLNPLDVVRWNLDKRYLRQLADRGVPVAPTVWLEPGQDVDLADILNEQGWTRAFLKPVVGANARLTRRFTPETVGAAQAWLAPVLATEGMMLQPYLPAVETFGEVSAVCVDGRVGHGVRKVPAAGDYRVQDDWGATDTPYAFSEADLALVEHTLQAAAEALGRPEPLCYARVDLLQDEDGNWVLTELELIEPSMFFRHGPETADRLADAVVRRIR